MIIKNALMTAEEMIWVNFLYYETLPRTCSDRQASSDSEKTISVVFEIELKIGN